MVEHNYRYVREKDNDNDKTIHRVFCNNCEQEIAKWKNNERLEREGAETAWYQHNVFSCEHNLRDHYVNELLAPFSNKTKSWNTLATIENLEQRFGYDTISQCLELIWTRIGKKHFLNPREFFGTVVQALAISENKGLVIEEDLNYWTVKERIFPMLKDKLNI